MNIKIHRELWDKLLEILPTTKEEAINIYQLKQLMSWALWILSIFTIRKRLQELRLWWVPILWNNRWSYISYDSDSIVNHKHTIDKMKEWFCTWMDRINRWYDIALVSDKIIN